MKKVLQKTFEVPSHLIIDEVQQMEDGDTVVKCHPRAKAIACIHCDGKTSGYDRVANRKRHTVVSGKTVWLEIRKRRMRCKQCKRTFVEPIEGISRSWMSDHMVQQVQEKSRGQDYTRVAKEYGVAISTVSRKVNELPLQEFHLPKKKSSPSE